MLTRCVQRIKRNPFTSRRYCETKQLIDSVKKGNRRALSKAITLVESTNVQHRKIAAAMMQNITNNPRSKNTLRIGLSGSPGVGKSTFIDTIGQYILTKNLKLAILAVDPSSSVNGGSILGDKTRMNNLAQDDRCYVRPSPSSGTLGGVTKSTSEAIILCEEAGYDIIIVETVGVGQSEITGCFLCFW
eukprot:TRINITY_DN756_c0_g1_i1.p2 TRINITY_DN756_c0_g1~~TRINITY_DN756_c0_g1_i1.p2  ORF type:complete len:188 (+),score=36.34 TRINITY_DN756_c0_g1_i1:59-622(+)